MYRRRLQQNLTSLLRRVIDESFGDCTAGCDSFGVNDEVYTKNAIQEEQTTTV